jgi:hypothetical protein
VLVHRVTGIVVFTWWKLKKVEKTPFLSVTVNDVSDEAVAMISGLKSDGAASKQLQADLVIYRKIWLAYNKYAYKKTKDDYKLEDRFYR